MVYLIDFILYGHFPLQLTNKAFPLYTGASINLATKHCNIRGLNEIPCIFHFAKYTENLYIGIVFLDLGMN